MDCRAKDAREYRKTHILSPTQKKRANCRRRLGQAVRRGRFARGSCAICGANKKIEAHHSDYDHPFFVTWLCRDHHVMVTMDLIEAPPCQLLVELPPTSLRALRRANDGYVKPVRKQSSRSFLSECWYCRFCGHIWLKKNDYPPDKCANSKCAKRGWNDMTPEEKANLRVIMLAKIEAAMKQMEAESKAC